MQEELVLIKIVIQIYELFLSFLFYLSYATSTSIVFYHIGTKSKANFSCIYVKKISKFNCLFYKVVGFEVAPVVGSIFNE